MLVQLFKLKAVDTIGNITQNNYWHKTFLGDGLWGEVDDIKHREKRLPLKCHIVLEKEVIFHECDFETSDLELVVSKST